MTDENKSKNKTGEKQKTKPKNKMPKALEYFQKAEYDRAIDEFTKMLELEGDNAEIYNNLGLCYANKNNSEKAEKYYLKAIDINYKLPQVYINLTDIYFKEKKFGDAVGLLNTAIAKMPDNMVLRHYLARVYMEDSRLDLAIDELDTILESQPENYDAYYDMARVYFEFGNYEVAIQNFENVIKYKDDNEWVYYYLGQSYEANDEIDKAISNYLRAITVENDFAPAYKKLGVLFTARGDVEDAIEYFEDYIKTGVPKEEADSINKIMKKLKN